MEDCRNLLKAKLSGHTNNYGCIGEDFGTAIWKKKDKGVPL